MSITSEPCKFTNDLTFIAMPSGALVKDWGQIDPSFAFAALTQEFDNFGSRLGVRVSVWGGGGGRGGLILQQDWILRVQDWMFGPQHLIAAIPFKSRSSNPAKNKNKTKN